MKKKDANTVKSIPLFLYCKKHTVLLSLLINARLPAFVSCYNHPVILYKRDVKNGWAIGIINTIQQSPQSLEA